MLSGCGRPISRPVKQVICASHRALGAQSALTRVYLPSHSFFAFFEGKSYGKVRFYENIEK